MPVLETALFYAATFPISPTVFAGKFLHDKWRNRDGVFEESYSAQLLRTAQAFAASRTNELQVESAAGAGNTSVAAIMQANASESEARVEAIDAGDDGGWADVVAMLQRELRRQIEAAQQLVRNQRHHKQTVLAHGCNSRSGGVPWRSCAGASAPTPAPAHASLHTACAGLAALAAWLVHVERPANTSDSTVASASSSGCRGDVVRGIIDSGAERAELDAALAVGDVLIESLCLSCRTDGGHCFVVRRGTSIASTSVETDTESTAGAEGTARHRTGGVASAPAEGRVPVRSSSRSVVATAVSDGETGVASPHDHDVHAGAGANSGGKSTGATARDNAILGAMLLMPPPLERHKVDVVENSARKAANPHENHAATQDQHISGGMGDGDEDSEDILSRAVRTVLLHFDAHRTKAPDAALKRFAVPNVPSDQDVSGKTRPPTATVPKVSKLQLRRREPLSPSSGPAATVGALRSLHAARARFVRRRLNELRRLTAAMSRLGEAMWDGSWQILLLGACPDVKITSQGDDDTDLKPDACSGTNEQLMPEAARWLLRAFAAIVDCPSRPPPPPSTKLPKASTASTNAPDGHSTTSRRSVSDLVAPPHGAETPGPPAPGRLLLPFSVMLPAPSMRFGKCGFEFREEDDVGFEIFQRRELDYDAEVGNTSDDDDSCDTRGNFHSSALTLVALVRAPRRFAQERQRPTSSVLDRVLQPESTVHASIAGTQHGETSIDIKSGVDATEALPPLLAAAAENDILLLRVLLNAGFPPDSINCVDANGRSALAVAAHAGHEEAVTVLLDAVRLSPDNKSGSAPAEAVDGDARLRRWVDLRDVNGHTALQHARECGHAGVAALLITAGATEASSGSMSILKAKTKLDVEADSDVARNSSEAQLSDRRGFRVPRVFARNRNSNLGSGPGSSTILAEEACESVGIATGMHCTTYPSVRNTDTDGCGTPPQVLSSPGFRHPNHHRRAIFGPTQGDTAGHLGAALEKVANGRSAHRRRAIVTDESPTFVRAHSRSAPVSPALSPPSAGREHGISACFRVSKGAELARSPFDAHATCTRMANGGSRVTEPRSARLPYRYQKQKRRHRQQPKAPSTPPVVSALLGGR